MKSFPIPASLPATLGDKLSKVGKGIGDVLRRVNAEPTESSLEELRHEYTLLRRQAIFLQEELDWHCYHVYGLLPDILRYAGNDLSELALGERPFEIVMARQMSKGELETTWFKRHGSTPIIDCPNQWPTAYRNLVERRIKIIETNNEIALIEKPEYKRRWNVEPWAEHVRRALTNWLLDRLENANYRKGTNQKPALTSTAQMADVASGDADFLRVAALFRGRSDFDVSDLVTELVEGEAVPFLPVLRYKPSGLRKREVWEQTWGMQRQQDGGEASVVIPAPPEYSKDDFAGNECWALRGRLDVPKERWISYPHCFTESDRTLVVGWAGWGHLEQATALQAYYEARKREGWDAKRLTPLLAGLDQLLPWIHQWHPEIDPEYGETAGQSFQQMLESDAHELGLTLEDVRKWTPPVKQTKASQKKAKEQPQ